MFAGEWQRPLPPNQNQKNINFEKMKKYIITLILLIVTTLMSNAQTTTIASVHMFNGYGEENTIVSIEKDTADRYYIETKIERTDSSFGRIYIATGREEAKEVLKEMEYFLDHPMVEYTMLGIKDDYLKLFREAEEVYYEDDECIEVVFYEYVTDGTESYSDLPKELIKKALHNLKKQILWKLI